MTNVAATSPATDRKPARGVRTIRRDAMTPSAVRALRAASNAASTREYRHHHLFRQLAPMTTDFVCIPRHVSEERPYFPVKLLPPEVIASNATFQCADPDGLQFALLSSSMFLTWQRSVGGRLKSDLRFGSTLTWTTLPLPALEDAQRLRIVAAGAKVLAARALHPDRSLAQHYTALGQPRRGRAGPGSAPERWRPPRPGRPAADGAG